LFSNEGFPIYKNSIRNSKDLRISESKLHQMVCDEFMKKKGFINKEEKNKILLLNK